MTWKTDRSIDSNDVTETFLARMMDLWTLQTTI